MQTKSKNDVMVGIARHGKAFFLTTDSPLSSYGIPVLRIKTRERAFAEYGYPDGDYQPGDVVISGVSGATIVAAWARRPERKPEELKLAQLYLSQWPDGPQV
jgi:hypothetical protein